MENEIKICAYRNCNKELVIGYKKEKIYCNVKCRSNEKTYMKRMRRKERKQLELQVISQSEFFNENN